MNYFCGHASKFQIPIEHSLKNVRIERQPIHFLPKYRDTQRESYLHMQTCIIVCIYIYIYGYAHTFTHIYTHSYTHMCTYTTASIYIIYTNTDIYTHTHIYIYIYIYIYIKISRSAKKFIFYEFIYLSILFLHTCMFPPCCFRQKHE